MSLGTSAMWKEAFVIEAFEEPQYCRFTPRNSHSPLRNPDSSRWTEPWTGFLINTQTCLWISLITLSSYHCVANWRWNAEATGDCNPEKLFRYSSCSHAHLTLFALVNIETPVLTYFAFYTRKNHWRSYKNTFSSSVTNLKSLRTNFMSILHHHRC